MSQSVLLLLSDISAISSYVTLFEKAASLVTEDGSLDVLIVKKITQLNLLDRVLAGVYTLATETLTRLNRSQVDVSVLFNDHYKDTEQQWQVCVEDASDKSYGALEWPDKELLDLVSIQRTSTTARVTRDDPDDSEESIHDISAVGGTFDHFHDGHKILLTASAFVTKTKLIVGVTDHELLNNKKYPEFLQSYDYRVHVLTKFVKRIKPHLIVEPVPIRDVCGPTGTIADIDALIVSRETIKGAEFINKTRLERGFNELRVHVINVIGGEENDDFENKLSSTQLRKEEWELTQQER